MRTKLAAVLTVLSLLITPLSPVITTASAAEEGMGISTDGPELIKALAASALWGGFRDSSSSVL